MRKSYDFRTFRDLELAIDRSLGKPPYSSDEVGGSLLGAMDKQVGLRREQFLPRRPIAKS